MRIISKSHAYLQTMFKSLLKFQRNRHKTVGGVAHTRYSTVQGFFHQPAYPRGEGATIKRISPPRKPQAGGDCGGSAAFPRWVLQIIINRQSLPVFIFLGLHRGSAGGDKKSGRGVRTGHFPFTCTYTRIRLKRYMVIKPA